MGTSFFPDTGSISETKLRSEFRGFFINYYFVFCQSQYFQVGVDDTL